MVSLAPVLKPETGIVARAEPLNLIVNEEPAHTPALVHLYSWMLNAHPTPLRPHGAVAFVALSRQLMVNGLQEGTVAAGTPKKLATRACSTVPGGRAAAQVVLLRACVAP